MLLAARFGEALRGLQDRLDSQNFYAFNPSFDQKQPIPPACTAAANLSQV
ncbi:MAG: hypothetical protein HFE83_07555 [Lachnospiraceae bacterium]|jgi:hypothetical protein|nr:hypothetical protein [Lachnospiraceae bacterium]